MSNRNVRVADASRAFLRSAAVAAVVAVVVATAGAAPAAPTFATWTNTTSGTLNGVGFTVSSLTNPIVSSNLNLNHSDWGNAGIQSGIEYRTNSTNGLTVTFASAVSDLEFYLYYFRKADDGYASYSFDQAFTVTSGLTNSPVTGTTIDCSSPGFASGVIRFTGAITSFTITASGGSPSSSQQGFTMSLTATAVPGGGFAGLCIAGLSGVARRRRR